MRFSLSLILIVSSVIKQCNIHPITLQDNETMGLKTKRAYDKTNVIQMSAQLKIFPHFTSSSTASVLSVSSSVLSSRLSSSSLYVSSSSSVDSS